MNKDEQFMKEALKQAHIALKKDEIPVGAVVVKDGKVIAKAYNMVEKMNSQLGHAELIAIKKASKKLKNWRLSGCTVYVTLEPCKMCMDAISLSRMSTIIYGTKNQVSSTGKTWVTGGVLEYKCSKLIKDFFKKIRKERCWSG